MPPTTPDNQPHPGRRRDDKPLIRLEGLHKSFGAHHVLKGVSLGFRRGRTTVVVGPSGCGKTVMLKHVIGLIRADRGTVWYGERRLDGLTEVELGPVRQEFGFLFQNGALFDSLSAHENIEFPLREHTSMTAPERDERVHHVLSLVGLADAPQKMPAELSGGQRKRVALARAIVLDPKVILYDEPTTGLDPIRSDVINELILKLQRELHTTSIVVTHDLVSAFKVADHMVMLYDGRVVLSGSPHEFRRSRVPLVQWFMRGEAGPDGAEAEPPVFHPDDSAVISESGP